MKLLWSIKYATLPKAIISAMIFFKNSIFANSGTGHTGERSANF